MEKKKLYIAAGITGVLILSWMYYAFSKSKKDDAAANDAKDPLKMTTGTNAIQRGIDALKSGNVKTNVWKSNMLSDATVQLVMNQIDNAKNVIAIYEQQQKEKAGTLPYQMLQLKLNNAISACGLNVAQAKAYLTSDQVTQVLALQQKTNQIKDKFK